MCTCRQLGSCCEDVLTKPPTHQMLLETFRKIMNIGPQVTAVRFFVGTWVETIGTMVLEKLSARALHDTTSSDILLTRTSANVLLWWASCIQSEEKHTLKFNTQPDLLLERLPAGYHNSFRSILSGCKLPTT